MALVFLALTAVFAVFFYLFSIFITFIVGLSLIILTERISRDYKRGMRKYRYPNWKRQLYGYSLLVFWVAIVVMLAVSQFNELVGVVGELSRNNQTITSAYVGKAEQYISTDLFEAVPIENLIRSSERYVVSTLTRGISKVSVFMFNAILIVPLMFYMYYRRGGRLKRQFLEVLPGNLYGPLSRAFDEIGHQLNKFLTAKVLESLIVGSICCLGFFVAGLKGWLLLGMIAGFLNIVPYLGPIIGAIPPLLIGVLDEPVVAVYVLATVITAQLVDNLYLVPFMISSKVRMDALLSIFLILAGAKIFGVAGMIFAIPLYLVYKIILRASYAELVRYYSSSQLRSKHPR